MIKKIGLRIGWPMAALGGQPGACTVIINDKETRRACLTKMMNLDAAEIITVEGRGTLENHHLMKWAFILDGGLWTNDTLQQGFQEAS